MPEEHRDKENSNRIHAAEIVRKLKTSGYEAYFVGGCVRDFILGFVSSDYDIVTSARPNEITSLFPNTIAIGAKFGVIAIIVENHLYEVATFRGDDVYEDGRHPSRIHFSSAREDVFRRDFTINGLLMDPDSNKIIDYVDGRSDINNKIIRTIGDPEKRFNEDYLRMLRAVRFASNLDFIIEPATQRAIKKNAEKIKQISAERLREEIGKILTRGGARHGFKLMADTGILKAILPEVDKLKGVEQPPRFHPEGDVWQHTLNMLDLLPQSGETNENICLAWSVLLHDIGKAVTRTEDDNGVHFYGHVQQGEIIADDIMQQLKFSNAQKETVLNLIHHHMVFMNVQKMRPARLKRFLRMPDFDLHLELHRLDCLASHGILDNYEFCRDQLRSLNQIDLHPPRLLTGDDLIIMGFAPGKIIGKILTALEEEQLEGKIRTTEEARDYVRVNWMKQ